jgi:hypothetical protein
VAFLFRLLLSLLHKEALFAARRLGRSFRRPRRHSWLARNIFLNAATNSDGVPGKLKVYVSLAKDMFSFGIPAPVNRSITLPSTPHVMGLMNPSGRWRRVCGTYFQDLRHQRRIIWNPIPHDDPTARLGYAHHLLRYILTRKNRTRFALTPPRRPCAQDDFVDWPLSHRATELPFSTKPVPSFEKASCDPAFLEILFSLPLPGLGRGASVAACVPRLVPADA